MIGRPTGLVSLVGAGPGHPDHLTQKAVRRLRAADLVLYDALVSPQVRAIAATARQVFVGKRARRPQTSQRAIEQQMIAAARAGLRVVRLKGGDPFVFGRGGEEALALQQAGVPFEIVPGVSSAVAAPALAGIPVTHRGVSPGFMVVAGADESAASAAVDGLPPNLITLVVLMGLGARESLAHRLLARGWAAGTPTAVILGAATPQMWVWKGTLVELAGVVAPEYAAGAPGTIVVGAVTALPIDLVQEASCPTEEAIA